MPKALVTESYGFFVVIDGHHITVTEGRGPHLDKELVGARLWDRDIVDDNLLLVLIYECKLIFSKLMWIGQSIPRPTDPPS